MDSVESSTNIKLKPLAVAMRSILYIMSIPQINTSHDHKFHNEALHPQQEYKPSPRPFPGEHCPELPGDGKAPRQHAPSNPPKSTITSKCLPRFHPTARRSRDPPIRPTHPHRHRDQSHPPRQRLPHRQQLNLHNHLRPRHRVLRRRPLLRAQIRLRSNVLGLLRQFHGTMYLLCSGRHPVGLPRRSSVVSDEGLV